MELLRTAGKLVGVVLAASVLSGCNANVQSHVAVATDGNVTLTETAKLDGQAGQEVAKSIDLQRQLTSVIESRTGQPAALSITASSVSWSQTMSYDQLIKNADVTGVGALAYETLPGSSAKVSVQLTKPVGLLSAIEKAVASRKDAAALTTTMEAYTDVCVSVSFPGTAQLVAASGVRPSVSGNTATLTQPIGSFIAGSFVVVGSLKAPSSPMTLWYWLVGGAFVVWFAWWMLKRR